MKPRRLLNLLSTNARRGAFRADAASNTIELYDVIVSSDEEAAWFGGVSLQAFAKALDGMSGTVHLRINSPGGDVFAGIAMAQRMREYKGQIIAHIDGYAASAASVVAIAASNIVMAPASMMMIHKAWTFAIGNADDLLDTADLLDKIDGQLADAYAGASKQRSGAGKSSVEFLQFMKDETWLTPQEAIDCGLCDEIAPENQNKSASARGLWDVSAFDRAPPAPAKPQQSGRPSETETAAAEKAAAEAAALIVAEQSEHASRKRRARLLETTA